MLENQTFPYKNWSHRYKYFVVNRDIKFFTDEEALIGKKYYEILICQMIDFLTDNIYIKIENHLCQCVGISVCTNRAPLLALCFFYPYEMKISRSVKK